MSLEKKNLLTDTVVNSDAFSQYSLNFLNPDGIKVFIP